MHISIPGRWALEDGVKGVSCGYLNDEEIRAMGKCNYTSFWQRFYCCQSGCLQSDPFLLPESISKLGNLSDILQGVLLVTLVVILVRRVRRVVYALRNKNRR